MAENDTTAGVQDPSFYAEDTATKKPPKAPKTAPLTSEQAKDAQAKLAAIPKQQQAQQQFWGEKVNDLGAQVQEALDRSRQPPPTETETSPAHKWGSAAMVIAAFAGALTHQPLTASLNAMAAVNTAYKAKDDEAYKKSYAAWKASHDDVMTILKYQQEQLEKADAAYAKSGDAQTLLANYRALGAATQNQMLINATNAGNVDAALKTSQAIQSASTAKGSALADLKPTLSEQAKIGAPSAVPNAETPEAAPGGAAPAPEALGGTPAAAAPGGESAKATEDAQSTPAPSPSAAPPDPSPSPSAVPPGLAGVAPVGGAVPPGLANVASARNMNVGQILSNPQDAIAQAYASTTPMTKEQQVLANNIFSAYTKDASKEDKALYREAANITAKIVPPGASLDQKNSVFFNVSQALKDTSLAGRAGATAAARGAAKEAAIPSALLPYAASARKDLEAQGLDPKDPNNRAALDQRMQALKRGDLSQKDAEHQQLIRKMRMDPTMSDDALMDLAKMKFATGQELAGFGETPNRDRANGMYAKLVKDAGLTQEDMKARWATVAGATKGLSLLSEKSAAANAMEQAASDQLDAAVAAAKTMPDAPIDVQYLDKAIRGAAAQVGNVETAAYHTYLVGALDEYAKILSGASGSQGATDAARAQALSLIPPGATLSQISTIVDAMKKGMAFKRKSWEDGIKAQQAKITEYSSAPRPNAAATSAAAATPSAPAQIPPEALAALAANVKAGKAGTMERFEKHFELPPGSAAKLLGQQ